MRTVNLTIYNNKLLEIFTKQRATIYDGFDVWIVGDIEGQRTVLDHFITNEHFEGFLVYSQAGDLIWRDAQESDIPAQKTKIAEQAEESIQARRYRDLDHLIYYFNGTLSLPCDRKTLNAAKKALLGSWTDGIATITFSPESKLEISCPNAASHPLCAAAHFRRADWWNFAHWMLWLMNGQKKAGERMGVWRCDERELHIISKQRDRLAHVFHKVQQLNTALGI